ncbi:MAG: hypothetical protein WCW84_10345 [Sulfurimonas sp.]|jgi:hypothetical protein
MSKELTQKDKRNWVYKKYENAISRSHPDCLDEEMKIALLNFTESDDTVALYYESARMISYPQPLWYVKLIVNRKIGELVKGSLLEPMKQILIEQMIRGATQTVIKKSTSLASKNNHSSNSFPKKKTRFFIFQYAKILTNFLARWKTLS